MWGELGGLVREGDILKIQRAYTKLFKDVLTLYIRYFNHSLLFGARFFLVNKDQFNVSVISACSLTTRTIYRTRK